MTNPANPRRRPSVHITLPRAARLHRLVRFLAEKPRARSAILSDLRIGLRTFYRELDLLNRCGVKVRHKLKLYHLVPTAAEAEGRLPFPDPQLSFAEMAELSQCPVPGRRAAGGAACRRDQSTRAGEEETRRQVAYRKETQSLKSGRR